MEGLADTLGAGHGEPRTEPIWERPWSLDEIRGNSESWSLAADAGLLNFLKEFSQQTISKTHEIEKQLDGLIHDTKTTNCRLHNIFNDFLMLANTQFIENRVYDEEVAEPIPKPDAGDKPEQEKTREQKEAELIPKVQEAINYGLQVLESAFEQLDIKAGNSDSEEEEVNERVEPIFEPKDLYLDRPLPHLIGSRLFMEQEDVGLGDFSSEEGSVDHDRASGIDSEEEEDERVSEDDSENRSEGQRLQAALSEEDDDDDGSNLFDSEKEEEEDNLEDNTESEKRPRPTSFADELAARIQGDVPNKANGDQESLPPVDSIRKKQVKEKREIRHVPSDDEDDDDDNLFKPPKLTDEDFSPFGAQGGLFSGGTGLFDDDEDDLFVDVPRAKKEKESKTPLKEDPSPSNPVKKIPVGAISLFPGIDHVFSTSSVLNEKDKSRSPTPKSETAPKLLANSGLFDDDEDDFFAKLNPKQTDSGKSVAEVFVPKGDGQPLKGKSAVPPLTQNNAATKSETAKETIGKKTPSPEESKLLAPPPLKTGATGLFSDEEGSEDLFATIQNATTSKASSVPASKTPKALSLFDDEEEDNLFKVAPAIKQITIKPPQEKIKAEEPTKTAASTLFSSDEEDHWNHPKPVKSVAKEKQKDSLTPRDQTVKVEKKTSLFDEEEEDLFAITKDSTKTSHRASLLFEDDISNEGALFSAKPISAEPTLQIPEKDALEQVPSSLFHEKKDGLVKRTEKASTQVMAEPAKQPDDAVDVLGKTDTLVARKKEVEPPIATVPDEDDYIFPGSPKPNKEGKNVAKNVSSLFGEDEDDDIIEDQLIIKSTQKEIKKPFEKSPHSKSTGVFQDEELLFSHKLQKDNDPDVDLFASAKKHTSEKPGRTKSSSSSGAGLFGDEEEDDLFSTTKSKQPPMTSENKIVVCKDTSETAKQNKLPKKKQDLGTAEANLLINPATLLPGAVFKVPGEKPSLPGLIVSAHHHEGDPGIGASSAKTKNGGVGVSFDHPANISTLPSANKDRIKVAGKRRPPSRAGRRLSSQDSGETEAFNSLSPPHLSFAVEAATITDAEWSQTEDPKAGTYKSERVENVFTIKPSASANGFPTAKNTSVSENPQAPDTHDVFSSGDLFANSAVPKTSTEVKTKENPSEGLVTKPPKGEKKSALSLLHEQGSDDDLFQSAKQKPTKKTKPSPFFDNEGEEDLFGDQKATKKKDVKSTSEPDLKQKAQNLFEDDIFASEVIKPAKKLKEKDKTADTDIFDENMDIFADITVKPKEKKSKKKVEPKSIFDDEMDDIFSSGNQGKASKSKVRVDKSPLEAKSKPKGSNTFDDPLNAIGGQ